MRTLSFLFVRIFALLGVAAALSCAALSFGIPAAHADDTSGIAGVPSDGTSPDGRTRFSYQIGPGQSVTDAFEVRNSGTTAQTMTVFAADAYNTDDGSYGLLQTGAKSTDAGSWVAFANGATSLQVPLEAGAKQTLQFTVTVPADARPGDHAAGMVISVTSPQGQVLVDRRVATRLYVRVPGDLQPALTISSITSSYDPSVNPFDGTATITVTVKNSGNVALGANLVAGVNTYFGIPATGIVRQDVSEILPGNTRTLSVAIPGVGQIGYLNPYVSMQPTVDADALNPGPLAQVNRDTVTFAVPWLVLVLLFIAAVIWVSLRLRGKNDEKRAKAWMEYTEAEALRRANGQAADDSESVGK